MWRRIAGALQRFQRSRYRASVERALALQGEGRPDGLTLVTATSAGSAGGWVQGGEAILWPTR